MLVKDVVRMRIVWLAQKECSQMYYKANKGRIKEYYKEYGKVYRKTNAEAISIRMKEYQRGYREDNKAKFHAYRAKYRAVQLERTLTGIDNLDFEVFLIYEEASEMRKAGYDDRSRSISDPPRPRETSASPCRLSALYLC